MKAYIATDKNCDSGISLVVFAETAGKAKAYAANREEFDYYTFTDMSVRRCPQLDKYYCGGEAMELIALAIPAPQRSIVDGMKVCMKRTVTGMTKEYLEKEAALEIATEQSNDWLYDAINAIPAANVRENVKGEWIQYYATTSDNETLPYGWECSLCGRWEIEKQPFCNCGADMAGGNDGRT